MNEFYEKHHQQYFDDTVAINPASFLEPLVDVLDPGASILDVGCGSGRDLLWFKQHGFKPTGFEQSPGLVQLAQKHSGCPVIEGDFFHFDFSFLHFDALISVGSLVHVPAEIFEKTLLHIVKALSSEGVMLITLKEGEGLSHAGDGRIFTLWSPDTLENIFSKNNFELINFSRKISKLRSDDIWLGYVLKVE